MTSPIAVRMCWIGVVVIAAAAIALRMLPTSIALDIGPVDPLNVPDVGAELALAAAPGDADALLGSRNPFDRDGERWSHRVVAPKTPPPPPPKRGAPEGIKGLLKAPGVEGVLTNNGFVSVGETVEGARVEQVERGEVVFSRGGKPSATWVKTDRDERRKAFGRLGLPLDEVEPVR